jgi:nucleotide sugar dehydrogenase
MDTQEQGNTENSNKVKIGFIGQGWIGKHYADDFENRGLEVVRYALETQYAHNREAISTCDIVFIAVPTPTTENGFDISIVEGVPLVGSGKIAVIKSTIVPGTTEALQEKFPDIFVIHSPEFLVEKTAQYDAAHPNRNIVGIPKDNPEYRERAKQILSVLPVAPFSATMHSKDAEFVKYAGNCFLFTKVMYANMLYDLVNALQGNWESIKEAVGHDPRIGMSHLEPVPPNGRGAGGHCFIKDFEAFRRMYDTFVHDQYGNAILEAEAYKNISLLVQSKKDIELLEGVYGDLSKYQ